MLVIMCAFLNERTDLKRVLLKAILQKKKDQQSLEKVLVAIFLPPGSSLAITDFIYLCYSTVTCKVFYWFTSTLLNQPQRKLGQSCANSIFEINFIVAILWNTRETGDINICSNV